VALAALGALNGEMPGVFFTGQRYGLLALEAMACAISFSLFDVSAGSGGSFGNGRNVGYRGGVFALAARRLGGLIVDLLLFCPAWWKFSVKARGGYVSAVFFAGLSAWLCAHIWANSQPKPGAWIGVGATSAGLALSQALFFIAFVPFLIALVKGRAT
jgi:hypothetical protein